jgi:SAM-dependent methyltransferase
MRLEDAVTCPLCNSDRPFPEARVATAPIVTYWRQIDYDIQAAFPSLPEFLTKQRCPRCDLRFFLPRVIGGADLYATLQRTAFYYEATKWEFGEVLRLLVNSEPSSSMLEFGCGRGRFLEQVRTYFDRVVGIDFNEDALADCRAKGLEVGSFDLAGIKERYDVVATFQVMEHLPNPGAVFAQLAGLVRSGGRFIVAVPNEDGPLGELQEDFLNLPPHHFTRWTKRTMCFLADAHGLEIEHYACEPLSETLFLTLMNERFARHLAERGLVARLIAAVARRIAIADSLTQFDATRKRLAGHTQIAVYHKATPSPA